MPSGTHCTGHPRCVQLTAKTVKSEFSPLLSVRRSQADDHAGLQAMTRLIPSASPVHYLLPEVPKASELWAGICKTAATYPRVWEELSFAAGEEIIS